MTALDSAPAYTLVQQIDTPTNVLELLIPGEQAIVSFKTLRDSVTFTDKRVILRDVQGMTGKKVEMTSLPYKTVNAWSSENAGTFDINAEITLDTRAGAYKFSLRRGVDVGALDRLIAQVVL
jgi:hypothetical protein